MFGLLLGFILGLPLFLGGNVLAARLLRARGIFPLRGEDPAAPGWRRVVVALAGAIAIYLVAAGCFTGFYLKVEVPTAKVRVASGMPAEVAGIRDGDTLVALDGREVADFPELAEAVRAREQGKQPVALDVRRGSGALERVEVTLDERGLLGVQPSGEQASVPLGRALARGLEAPALVIAVGAQVLAKLVYGELPPEQLAGPVAYLSTVTANRGAWLYVVATFLSYTLPLAVLISAVLAIVAATRLVPRG